MVPFARRVRTIRRCSLDARSEGPIQATLLKNDEEKLCEKEGAGLVNPLCSQSPYDKAVVARCAQGGIQSGHPQDWER